MRDANRNRSDYRDGCSRAKVTKCGVVDWLNDEHGFGSISHTHHMLGMSVSLTLPARVMVVTRVGSAGSKGVRV